MKITKILLPVILFIYFAILVATNINLLRYDIKTEGELVSYQDGYYIYKFDNNKYGISKNRVKNNTEIGCTEIIRYSSKLDYTTDEINNITSELVTNRAVIIYRVYTLSILAMMIVYTVIIMLTLYEKHLDKQ